MAASLVVLSVLLGGSAQAQDGTRATNPPMPYPSTSTLPTTDSYYYTKPAGNAAPVPEKKSPFMERPAGNYQVPAAAARTGAWPGTATPAGNFYSTGYQSPKVQKGTVSPEAAGASPAVSGRPGGDEVQGFAIRLEPPGPQEIFGRLDSEANLQERIRQKAREQTPAELNVYFPPEPVVGEGSFTPRSFSEEKMFVEPNYVCYGRLYFEQLNAERYGWDIGPIAPIVSAGIFFKDVAFLPYHAFTNPLRCYECNTGYCLPGDPVPLMLYPPGLSLTGAFMEGGIGVALFAIFP